MTSNINEKVGGKMTSQILWFIGIMVVFTLLHLLLNREKKTPLSMRKEQAMNLLRENIIKKRIEKLTEEKVKYSKRYELETLCLQAGFQLTYAEYIMISLGSGIVLALLAVMVMNNPLLGIFFFFMGYMLPKQVITILKNRRVQKMEAQIGPFMQMVIMRYETTRDFARSMELTTAEFIGEEPLYSELRKTVLEINLGKPVGDAMDELARRTGNKYMARLSDYYKIASSIGTDEIRRKLLMQAYEQYEENRNAKRLMKKELNAVKSEAYVMLGAIPMFALFQIFTNDNYIPFMTETTTGRIGTVIIFGVFMGALWFINNKITAPLD